VITSRYGERPERWSWELKRKSSPLGVKLTDDGFQSQAAATFAGKRALIAIRIAPVFKWADRLHLRCRSMQPCSIIELDDSRCFKAA
jgi:hypothetical protein